MEVILINRHVKRFILSLEKSTAGKVSRIVTLLEDYGHQLGMPYSKRVERGLYELRIRGQQEVRFLYTIRDAIAYILHGFIKKTMWIPPKEIKIARKRLQLLSPNSL